MVDIPRIKFLWRNADIGQSGNWHGHFWMGTNWDCGLLMPNEKGRLVIMGEKKAIQFRKMLTAEIVLMLFAFLAAAVPVIAEDTNDSYYKDKLNAIYFSGSGDDLSDECSGQCNAATPVYPTLLDDGGAGNVTGECFRSAGGRRTSVRDVIGADHGALCRPDHGHGHCYTGSTGD